MRAGDVDEAPNIPRIVSHDLSVSVEDIHSATCSEWSVSAMRAALAPVCYSPAALHRGCFRHQLLLPSPYLFLTKPLRLDIQCQRAASVKIGWKYLDD